MTDHKTASASEIQVNTKPLDIGIGVEPPAPAIVPQPSLAGSRLIAGTGAPVWLIDGAGFKRLIPDADTYNNLFRDWNGIIVDVDINMIAAGPDLTSGAVLAQSSPLVWIVSNGVKRWIQSPQVMDQYYFSWDTIVRVPPILLQYIPTGNPWVWGS